MSNDSIPPRYLGVVCNATEWASSLMSDQRDITHPTLHCLTRGQSIGLTVTTQAAFVSLIAVLYLFALIIRNIRRHMRDPQAVKWSVVKEPADIYMLSLFIADLIQAVGTVLDIKWINEGKVHIGSFCTAQGVIQQLGETPVAMNTLAIAVHTFVTVWWGKALHARLIALGVVTCIWTYVILFIAIGVTARGTLEQPYMTPTPYWCWIGPAASDLRIWGEYLWLWLALASSFILYVPLFFWSRGNITVMGKWWKFRVHRKQDVSDTLETATTKSEHERIRKRVALGMLAYPITYSLIVLPLSIVRWITFGSGPIASIWTFFIISVYGLSGCANVLLVLITRPRLLLFGKSAPPTRPHRGRSGTKGALPSGSPSLSPSSSRRGNGKGWHDREPTAVGEQSSPRHSSPQPRITLTRTRASDEEYNPYGNSGEMYPLATRPQRISADGSSDGRPSPGLYWEHRTESGGLRQPESVHYGNERV